MNALLLFSIPVFLLLLVGEAWYSARKQLSFYTPGDTYANLGCGIVEQVVGILTKGILALGYIYVFDNYRLATWDLSSPLAWIVAFLIIDMIYYWFHRFAHRVNAVWATHIVHHQSEYYNLSVALRQSMFQGWFSWPFYLPVALMGVPPEMMVTCYTINLIYQFWIHTQLIHKLGPLEWFLNTPSHHRVHHGQNTVYIDKNYAGVLIVWDKMFGTFTPEVEEVRYGVTYPFKSSNPVVANFHAWIPLFSDAFKTSSWVDKLRLWWMPNGWRPADLEHTKKPNPWAEPSSVKGLSGMAVAGCLVAITVVSFGVLFFAKDFSLPAKVVAVGFILLFMHNIAKKI